MPATPSDPAAARSLWRWFRSLWATLDVLTDREALADLAAADEEAERDA